MSTLILFLPPRSRMRAQGRSAAAADLTGSGDLGRDYGYLLSVDGTTITSQGAAAAALLPHADTVIAIPAEADIAWQRVELPRAGRQMRSALAGMLEDTLLDDPEGLHFAIEPDAVGGDTAWVAITSRAWLTQHLGLLEAAQVFVDRIAPLSCPESQPRGHFYAVGNDQAQVALRWSHPGGVANLPLDGNLARLLFPASLVQSAVWTATPAVAEQAERWLGTTVTVTTAEQRAMGVIDGSWNLRQFELAQHTRGIRALRLVYRGLMRRHWRPVRIGLVGLVAVQLLGLNLLAWQQTKQLQAGKAALISTLTQSYPQVRAVLDAPVQMQRETESLRASAGRAGEQDLETLLAAAATAWPAERGPVDALSFEPGRLVLSATGWSEPQIAQFRSQLKSEGWQLDHNDGRMTLSRPPRKSLADTRT